jgi:hypothetical protein
VAKLFKPHRRPGRLPYDVIVAFCPEADVHRTGLATGLVDVKVAAIDEVWAGLRFVHRRTPT